MTKLNADNNSEQAPNGLLSRIQAEKGVGVFSVDEVSKKPCDFSQRVMSDNTVEFVATTYAKNEDGDEVLLSAFYYQDKKDVNDNELDNLDWKVAGYLIT